MRIARNNDETRRRARRIPMRATAGIALLLVFAMVGGCAAFGIAAAMGRNEEYQKKVEVLAEYDNLEGKTFAVLVNADMSLLYQFPSLVAKVTDGVSLRLAKHVEGTRFIPANNLLRWQYNTPQWMAMPYSELVESLGVDRVIIIDIYEFRLNPPGNRWEWEGAAAANVGILEKDSVYTDMFVAEYQVAGRFPTVRAVTQSQATPQQIETGVLAEFIKKTSWLFYDHTEPKHPDKYRPELDPDYEGPR